MDKARVIAVSTLFLLLACGESADSNPVDMNMEPVGGDGMGADGDVDPDGAPGDGDDVTPGDGQTGDGAPDGDGDDVPADGAPGDGDGDDEPGCVDDPATLGNDCPGQVSCSAAVDACSLESAACCVDDYKKDAVSCETSGGQCTGLATAMCDGKEDCGGQLCCISVSLFPMAVEHRCVATEADCTGGQLVNSLLCHTDADCTPDKPSCEAIGEFPWWGICK